MSLLTFRCRQKCAVMRGNAKNSHSHIKNRFITSLSDKNRIYISINNGLFLREILKSAIHAKNMQIVWPTMIFPDCLKFPKRGRTGRGWNLRLFFEVVIKLIIFWGINELLCPPKNSFLDYYSDEKFPLSCPSHFFGLSSRHFRYNRQFSRRPWRRSRLLHPFRLLQ